MFVLDCFSTNCLACLRRWGLSAIYLGTVGATTFSTAKKRPNFESSHYAERRAFIVMLNVIMLCFIALNDITLNVIMLSLIVLNAIMLSRYVESHYAKCRYVICHYADCRCAVYHCAKCSYVECTLC